MLILLSMCQNNNCLHLVQNNNTCLSTDSYFLQKLYNWDYCRMSKGFNFHCCRSSSICNAVLHCDGTNLFFFLSKLHITEGSYKCTLVTAPEISNPSFMKKQTSVCINCLQVSGLNCYSCKVCRHSESEFLLL
jgi:hypothetical protein